MQQLMLDNAEFREVLLDYEEIAHYIDSSDNADPNSSNDLTACQRVLEDLAAEILEFVNVAPVLPEHSSEQ